MKLYPVICVITFSLLGLILFGALFGDVDDRFFSYMTAGGVFGILFWYATRNKMYFSAEVKSVFEILMMGSWSAAFLSSVYALYGMVANKDMITGQRFDGMAGMFPYIVLIFAVMLFLIGLIFRWLANRRRND